MVRYLMAGDSHLVVEFGQIIDPAINQQVHALARCLTEQELPGLKEVVPTYRSLLVSYDPLTLPLQDLKERCNECISRVVDTSKQSREIVTIPNLFGVQYGVDLAGVAREVELTEQEVIDIHTSVVYPIYMIGFMPGYPYLGGLDKRIAVPRLKTPRTKVPAGSVAMAESQTGVYPIPSPGGWRLIGRTPLRLYRPEQMPPVLFRAGQYIRFSAVSVDEYLHLEQLVKHDKYIPDITTEEVH